MAKKPDGSERKALRGGPGSPAAGRLGSAAWGITDGRALWLLAAVTVACLIPFAGKAFHIDDPLFVWTARHLQAHPADFFGFVLNWSGDLRPMFDVTRNPPGACYFIALVGAFAGWSEVAIHLAFLVPALAAVLGTYLLARHFCRDPLLAALLALFTPAFLVSATTVMCDVMMLGLWVWAILLWHRGLESGRLKPLLAASFIIGLCTLTKYFGASLIPLLLAYSVAKERRVGAWSVCLLIPVVMIVAYELACLKLYGTPLFSTAGLYSVEVRKPLGGGLVSKTLVTLAFIGGGAFPVLFFAPLLWSRRKVAAAAGLCAALGAGLSFLSRLGVHDLREDGSVRWLLILHLCLFAAGGAQILLLALEDLRRKRDAPSVLLFLWVAGVLVFCVFLNWTVNIRTVLPLIPAAMILVVRRLEAEGAKLLRLQGRRLFLPLVPAAAVALLLACADCQWANSARAAAEVISQKYPGGDRTLWFEGHWGFQYYMEAHGGVAANWAAARFRPRDIMVLPVNNTGTFPIGDRRDHLRPVEALEFPTWNGLATMCQPLGAGFYSDVWGPLPFAFGRVPIEQYLVYEFR